MFDQQTQHVHVLPGGAMVEEQWVTAGTVVLRFTGEVDLFDKHELVDLLASCVLAGAHDVIIDAAHLDFVAVSTMHTLDRARRFLRRVGGTLDVIGLPPLHQRIWSEMTSTQTPSVRQTPAAFRLVA